MPPVNAVAARSFFSIPPLVKGPSLSALPTLLRLTLVHQLHQQASSKISGTTRAAARPRSSRQSSTRKRRARSSCAVRTRSTRPHTIRSAWESGDLTELGGRADGCAAQELAHRRRRRGPDPGEQAEGSSGRVSLGLHVAREKHLLNLLRVQGRQVHVRGPWDGRALKSARTLTLRPSRPQCVMGMKSEGQGCILADEM